MTDFSDYKRDLIGHERAEQAFSSAYRQGKLHHAWLITGPKGIGKATLAWRMAAFLQQEQYNKVYELTQARQMGLLGESDGLDVNFDHPAVRHVYAGSHQGIRHLQRSPDPKTGKMRKDIAVGQIRELIDFFTLTVGKESWRIAIIDAVDEMTRSASNALLKLLEEPPAMSILLMVCHAPGRLLPTVRSRCRQLALKPLDSAAMRPFYAELGLSLDSAGVLNWLTEGAPGRLKTMKDLNGTALYTDIMHLFESSNKLNISDVYQFSSKLSSVKSEPEYRLFVEIISRLIAQIIKVSATSCEADKADSPLLQEIAARAPLAGWLSLWDKMRDRFEKTLSLNLDKQQTIVACFTDLASLTGPKG